MYIILAQDLVLAASKTCNVLYKHGIQVPLDPLNNMYSFQKRPIRHSNAEADVVSVIVNESAVSVIIIS